MNYLGLILLFVLLKDIASAQIQLEDEAASRKSIVRLFRGGQSGTGFIFSIEDSTLFIATARHVVVGKNNNDEELQGDILVSMEGLAGHVKGRLSQYHDYYDLAIVEVVAANYEWHPLISLTDLQPSDSVGFLSVLQNKAMVPQKPGRIISITQAYIELNISNVQGGDSGTPLFCNQGIVGMITNKSPASAVPITLIRDIVKDWDYPWQLPLKNMKRPAPIEFEVRPDFNLNEITYKATFTTQGGCALNLKTINDDDFINKWECSLTMPERLVLNFEKEQTVREFRVFYPSNSAADLPRGKLTIPGQRSDIPLQRLLIERSIKVTGGAWYVFRLGKYYRTRSIIITLRSIKDEKGNPMPIVIHELKVMGTKS